MYINSPYDKSTLQKNYHHMVEDKVVKIKAFQIIRQKLVGILKILSAT